MMLNIFTLILIVELASSTPPTPQFWDDRVYTPNNTIYSADYDIVDIHYPTHFWDKQKVFIVEADIIHSEYKGLYVLNVNNDKTTTARKLLDNGKCITSDAEAVYFGTTNGIYTYNFSNDAVEKYGSITADIRDIEKDKNRDLMYIVTEDNQLYTVTEKGNKMKVHDTIENVHEIALDKDNNLYYLQKHEDTEKYLMFYEKYIRPKVLVDTNVRDIAGLPDKYYNIKLTNILCTEGAAVIINNNLYVIFPNGTSTDTRYMFLDMPTAYFLEAGIVHLYAHDRKLYLVELLIFSKEFGEKLGKALGSLIVEIGQALIPQLGN